MRRPTPLFSLVLFLALASCHETNTQNARAVKEEMRSREIVHATPGQIAQRATEMGDSLLEHLVTKWAEKVGHAPDQPCSLTFSSVQAEMKDKYKADIQLIRFEGDPLEMTKSKVEREVIDAYLYNKEHRLALEPNLQKDGDKELLYTRPFVLTKGLESCFAGSKPNAAGDTLGLWSVRMLKKNVVLSFVEKY
jgi:hypothetical protein